VLWCFRRILPAFIGPVFGAVFREILDVRLNVGALAVKSRGPPLTVSASSHSWHLGILVLVCVVA
jgi:hypothetical protein